jgi:hypothetical protein
VLGSVIEPSLPEDSVIVREAGDRQMTNLRRLRDRELQGALIEVNVREASLADSSML